MNSSIYRILNDTNPYILPIFVVLSNSENQIKNETLFLHYKSLTSELIFQTVTDWSLTVRVSQQYFYSNQLNQNFHVLCYLQFEIQNITKFIGRNLNCIILLNWHGKSKSKSGSCKLKIGRSPSICSTYFDLRGLEFLSSSPIWGSINAQLFFESNYIIATSLNSVPIIFNYNKPVNWTIVQQHDYFGQLAIGLPMTSVKAGANFIIPLSITKTVNVSNIRMFFGYDKCLFLNSIEVIDRKQWFLQTNIDRSKKKEICVIKLNKLSRKPQFNVSIEWPIVATLNMTVVERPLSDGACNFSIGISKVDLFSKLITRYFSRTEFGTHHKPVPVAIDPIGMDIVSFKEFRNRKVCLFSPANYLSFQVSTYVIPKLGNRQLPLLLSNSTCVVDAPRIISCPGYKPTKHGNSWVLPVTMAHWRTVLYDLESVWLPDSWRIDLSDQNLNPVKDWRVPDASAAQCSPLYQTARLTVAVKLASVNSLGLRTVLGASLARPDPWIDVTAKVKVVSTVPGIVFVLQTQSHSVVILVRGPGTTELQALDHDERRLASRRVTVSSSHLAVVVGVQGRCWAQLGLAVSPGHPGDEGLYVNVAVTSQKHRGGAKCHLWLTALFDDGTTLALDDLDREWYSLEIDDGTSFENGALIEYKNFVTVVLLESEKCDGRKEVYRGTVDLRRDGLNDWSRDTTMNVIGGFNATTNVIGGFNATTNVIGGFNATTNVIESEPLPTRNVIDGPRLADQSTDIFPNDIVMVAIVIVAGLIGIAVVIIIVNCIVGASVRRQPLFHLRRRLSKSHHLDSGHSKHALVNNEPYPSLLPPPGPILSASRSKESSEWALSSESGIHSSQGESHQSLHNGLLFVRQTSPISDTALLDSSMLQTQRHSCSGPSVWPQTFASPRRQHRHLRQSSPH